MSGHARVKVYLIKTVACGRPQFSLYLSVAAWNDRAGNRISRRSTETPRPPPHATCDEQMSKVLRMSFWYFLLVRPPLWFVLLPFPIFCRSLHVKYPVPCLSLPLSSPFVSVAGWVCHSLCLHVCIFPRPYVCEGLPGAVSTYIMFLPVAL